MKEYKPILNIKGGRYMTIFGELKLKRLIIAAKNEKEKLMDAWNNSAQNDPCVYDERSDLYVPVEVKEHLDNISALRVKAAGFWAHSSKIAIFNLKKETKKKYLPILRREFGYHQFWY